MIALPGGTTGSPGVRRPTFTIAFGAGGGAGGGLGGLASAVAGAAGLGGGSDDPWQRSLISLTVEAALAPVVDALELVLSSDSQAPSVAVGDAGTVSLGYADGENVLVFTGTIDRVTRGLDGTTRVGARNGGGELARLRLNQGYEQMSGADIASDLAGRTSLQTDVMESGETLAYVALDDRTSAWSHLATLARRGGAVAYVSPDGKLHFVKPGSGDPVQTFHYGADILALDLADVAAELGEVSVFGEGAAGSQGADAWAWIIKDPAAVTGSAGSGAPERSFADRALRSAEAAGAAARGLADAAAARKLAGRLRVAGAPAVTVGSVVEIADAPGDTLNGRFLVRSLRHRLEKRSGFVTEMAIVSAGGGGGGALGALGGLL